MVDKVQSIHLHKVLQVAVGTSRYVQEKGEEFGTAERRGDKLVKPKIMAATPQSIVHCV